MRMTPAELEPYMSAYLMGGWRQDFLELRWVEIERERIVGRVDVLEHFSPTNGVFHLAVPQAFVWVAQLAIIHGCWEHGLSEKPGEVYLREIALQCRKVVTKTKAIDIELRLSSKRYVAGGAFYAGEISVDEGAFVGHAKYVLPLPRNITVEPRRGEPAIQDVVS